MDGWCILGGFFGYCLGAFVVGVIKGLWAAHSDGSSDA